MTPNTIARNILERAKKNAKHDSLLTDELVKEIAKAISEERELISKYLNFLNDSIALRPELVRHRLLTGSTRLSTGRFLEEMHPDEHRSYALRLNSTRRPYYAK